MNEALKFKTEWRLRKYNTEKNHILGLFYDDIIIEGNLALNAGLNIIWALICSVAASGQYDNGNAELGVGDSAAAVSATQTDLQAAVNFAWVGMDSSYPTYGSSQKATWRATFDGSTGNFDWNEFAIKNGDGVLLNRKVSVQGTKAAGQVWELTLSITAS